MSHLYTEEQWQQIDALGHTVEAQLQRLGVGLTMGGEPTFISIDDFESVQWQVEALGDEKRKIAAQLLKHLKNKFSRDGALLHYGLGKWYSGEDLPRWALGCYWRRDGVPIWRKPELCAEDGKDYGHTQKQAEIFIQALAKHLDVNPDCIIPVDEPETQELAGYTLPLLPVLRAGALHWSTCHWQMPEGVSSNTPLALLKGNSPIGLRLPLNSIPWSDDLEVEAMSQASSAYAGPYPVESVKNSIRVALSVEAQRGTLHVFLPPLTSARSFLNLIAAIEDTAQKVGPVLIEGYPPPSNAGIEGFQVTPDPGVIEVNIQPAANWDELVKITTIVYQEARQCRLGTEKYTREGRRISTGGGAHITIGGNTTHESPLLRRPDLLWSLIRYWQNHPSLSYLFSGLFVGPTSQSPRVDEARHESLYELEVAFQHLQPNRELPAELVDCLLRNLLTDVTGNRHRAEFCIDKLFPVENPRLQLGLLEFRGFEMPPHERMRLLQMLLIRAIAAWFWEQPNPKPLIRWGTTLQDCFMLPYYIEKDFRVVIKDLQQAGYPFEFEWFQPFFEFRFPRYGHVSVAPSGVPVQLELRQAIEPWHVVGEATSGGARYVDTSMERLQVMLRGGIDNSLNSGDASGLPVRARLACRYLVTCNGQPLPLKSTKVPGEYVCGVRFRARLATALVHPAIKPHSPLVFNIVDTWAEQSIGGCTYYMHSPHGATYEKFPVNHQEAESRVRERFMPHGPTLEKSKLPPLRLNPEYPITLDLRFVL